MQSNEERPVDTQDDAAAPGIAGNSGASRRTPRTLRYAGTARTAPRGSDSRIGDDDTHRRLQEARNRARHSIEDIVRRELGPEWADSSRQDA
jgi:hypothetical protein